MMIDTDRAWQAFTVLNPSDIYDLHLNQHFFTCLAIYANQIACTKSLLHCSKPNALNTDSISQCNDASIENVGHIGWMNFWYVYVCVRVDFSFTPILSIAQQQLIRCRKATALMEIKYGLSWRRKILHFFFFIEIQYQSKKKLNHDFESRKFSLNLF